MWHQLIHVRQILGNLVRAGWKACPSVISYRMTQDDKGIGVLLDLRAAWGWDCHIWSVTFLAESNQSEPPTAETSFMQNDGQMSSTANPCFLALQSCSASAPAPAYLRQTGICRMRAHAYKISLEWWRKPLCLGFVILFCLRTILRKASARTRLAYAKTHGQTLASASLTRTESLMMLLNVNIASASLPRRLV